MPRRLHEPATPVTLEVDGTPVAAQAGEPVAVALMAADKPLFGRSIKYHRPRGATCFQGRCDGCLMRVDGVPNVMTCRTPARDGMVCETQNVLGTADVDMLAATDWFFPGGMDHHRMFTRFKALNRVMQKVARRIAGIGTLPDDVAPVVAPAERVVDVLVIGGGPSGLAAAGSAAAAGASTWLVEESERLGGATALRRRRLVDVGAGDQPSAEAIDSLIGAAAEAGAELSVQHVALGVYRDERSPSGFVVVVGANEGGLTRVRPSALIVASGMHEGALLFPGNDCPGVVGARGALTLLSRGVVVGDDIALVGDGLDLEAAREELASAGVTVRGPFAPEEVLDVHGRKRVRGLSVEGVDGERERVPCDAIVVGAPESSAYELARQAGAGVRWNGEGFFVEAAADGRTEVDHVWAVGTCAGAQGGAGIDAARVAGHAAASTP